MLKKKSLVAAASLLSAAARVNLGLTCAAALHQPAVPKSLQGPKKG